MELSTFLDANPDKLKEAREYLLDHMSSGPRAVVSPDEAFLTFPDGQQVHGLMDEFLDDLESFYTRWWAEKLAPVMPREAFDKFRETLQEDIGYDFDEKCLTYLKNLE